MTKSSLAKGGAASDKLATRAAFDLLNNIAVSRDAIAFRSRPRSIVARVIAATTGESRRLETLFDKNTAESITNLHALVASLRGAMTESDVVLAKTIDTVVAVRDTVAGHGADIQGLRDALTGLNNELTRELGHIHVRLAALEAQALATRWLSEFAARAGAGGYTLADLWHAVDDLWWGPYGAFQRSTVDVRGAREVHQFLMRETQKILIERRSLAGTFPVAPLLAEIPVMPADDREELELFALDPDWETRPITRAVLTRSEGEPDARQETRSIPIVTTAERLSERLFDEAARPMEG